MLSDGKDSGPIIGTRQRPGSQADVIDRARLQDVMIYAVGLRSRRTRSTPPGIGPGGLQSALLADLPDPGLARVAEETGGGYLEIRFGQDLGAAFAAVADELHTQYLLAFAPPSATARCTRSTCGWTRADGKPARGKATSHPDRKAASAKASNSPNRDRQIQ